MAGLTTDTIFTTDTVVFPVTATFLLAICFNTLGQLIPNLIF